MSASQPVFNDYYDTFLGGKFFRWVDCQKISFIKSRFSASGTQKILDWGCGNGTFARRLMRLCPGLDITGVDYEDKNLEAAANNGVRVKKADFNKPLPFEKDFFDCVLMVDTIEHVESRHAAFREALRILRPGGSAIIFTPAYDSVSWLLGEYFFKLLTRRTTGHISPFTKESLSWFMQSYFQKWRAGFLNFGLTLYAEGKKEP